MGLLLASEAPGVLSESGVTILTIGLPPAALGPGCQWCSDSGKPELRRAGDRDFERSSDPAR